MNVGNDQIRWALTEERQPFTPVRRLHNLIAGGAKRRANHRPNRRLIVMTNTVTIRFLGFSVFWPSEYPADNTTT